jgi:hypothetical protein
MDGLTPSVNIPTACYLHNPLKPREEKTKQESDRTKDIIKELNTREAK